MHSSFSAKLLLFGEHTVLKGSQALAIPLSNFSGQWKFCNPSDNILSLQKGLPGLFQYLKELETDKKLLSPLDLRKMEKELKAGLYFDSNIPGGYGVGSSGALCAALYDRFHIGSIAKQLSDLKNVLAQIESFFHGASSGIDPLIIFVRRPIFIDSDKSIQTLDLSVGASEGKETFQYFLLDTGISRQTAPFVNLFLEKCQQTEYLEAIQSQLCVFTNEAINGTIHGNGAQVFDCLDRISQFQFDHFNEMIPEPFQDIWKEGLDSPNFKIKLCGAGGGGFLMGMLKKGSGALTYLKSKHSIITFKY